MSSQAFIVVKVRVPVPEEMATPEAAARVAHLLAQNGFTQGDARRNAGMLHVSTVEAWAELESSPEENGSG